MCACAHVHACMYTIMWMHSCHEWLWSFSNGTTKPSVKSATISTELKKWFDFLTYCEWQDVKKWFFNNKVMTPFVCIH